MLNSNEVVQGNFPFSRRYTASGPNAHNGCDIACPTGTPVIARFSGVIKVTGTNPPGQDFGNYIRMDYDNFNLSGWYAHLDHWTVGVGQHVSQGQVIAMSDNTGLSTGPHLHYSESVKGTTQWIDPDTTQGGEQMITDADNEFGRWSKTFQEIRGRSPSRDEFRASGVGQTWLRALEILEDDPEADQALAAQQLGQKAVAEGWEGQITALTNQVTNCTTQITDLQTTKKNLTDQITVLNNEVADLKKQLSSVPNPPQSPSQPLVDYSLGELFSAIWAKITRSVK